MNQHKVIITSITAFFAVLLFGASTVTATEPTQKEVAGGERAHYCQMYGEDVFCSWEEFWCWYTDGHHVCNDWPRVGNDTPELDALIEDSKTSDKKDTETGDLAGREQMCVYLGDETYYCTNGTVYCIWGEEWFCDFI